MPQTTASGHFLDQMIRSEKETLEFMLIFQCARVPDQNAERSVVEKDTCFRKATFHQNG